MNRPELKRTVPLTTSELKALVGKRVKFYTGFDGRRGMLYGGREGTITRTARKRFELDGDLWFEHGKGTFEFAVLD